MNGNPSPPGLTRDTVLASVNSNQLEQAKTLCQELCRHSSQDGENWLLLAAIHARLGALGEVVACCRKAAGLQPGNAAAHFNLGVALQMQNKLEPAAAAYQEVLRLAPHHVPALSNLGIALRALGRPAEAMQVFQQAANLQPELVEARSNLGLCLMDLGQLNEAIRCFEQAMAMNPNVPDVVGSLSAALMNAGRLHEAIELLQAALIRLPGNAHLHFAAGNAYRADGQRQAAAASYQHAIALDPRHYAACNNLGSLFQESGQPAEAERLFRVAQQINPNAADLHYNLATVLAEQGRHAEALNHSLTAVRLCPDALQMRQQFTQQIGVVSDPPDNEELVAEIQRTYRTPGIDYQYLAPATLALVRRDKDFDALESSHTRHGYSGIMEGLRQRRFLALFRKPLWRSLLTQTVVCCAETEKLLTALRKALLVLISEQRHKPSADEIDFVAVLACQCGNNEYAYLVDQHESELVDALAESIDGVLEPGQADVMAYRAQLGALAMYRPLRLLRQWHALLQFEKHDLSPAMALLFERQIDDWAKELEIRGRIPRLTDIGGGVSSAVRNQYEESPYPRWISVALLKPRPYRQVLQELLPHFTPPRFEDPKLEVLIAGCGTGKHAILSKTRFADSEHLAIDLSAASLAYAQRKATELGLQHLRFAQADILELAGYPKRFHIVESVGVLHHLADPGAGLRILADLLHPGGLMNIGLYSARARRHITAARQHFHSATATISEDFMRCTRREIIDMDATNPLRTLASNNDFFSLSECRDLLFHVQEHCFTLLEVDSLLEAHGLRFLGFEFNSPRTRQAYQHAHPDSDLTDLRTWDRFEQDHPDVFLGMYVFWCQKT